LALTAAVESRSGHPLAQSVVRAAQRKELSLPEVVQVESLPGQGLRSSANGQALLIGSLRLMEESGVEVSSEAREVAAQLQGSGKTVMLVAVDRSVAGVIGLADTLRPDAVAAIAALRESGIRETVMLTGDNLRVAAAIASQAGLTQVRADLMPEDKVVTVQELLRQFGPTAMVGDGVNDAPALANATVGIAMGGAGTDVALETADVALMADDLGKLPFAVGLGRATRRVILQNLAIALGVIAFLIPASLTGGAGIGVAVLFHEGSTLLVVLNALRLLGYRGQTQ
jgi:Cd2+/Zn2+-exporting ATPase